MLCKEDNDSSQHKNCQRTMCPGNTGRGELKRPGKYASNRVGKSTTAMADWLKTIKPMEGKSLMIETAKYCQTCIDQLFPATAKTEKEQQFLNAHIFSPRPASDYGPTSEEGTCEKCGQHAIVTYYRLPG